MSDKLRLFSISVLLATLTLASGCATSPLGRSQLILVPDSQMDALGSQAFAQMKQQQPTVSDPTTRNYVLCVAMPIAQASAKDAGVRDWEVQVFRDDSANAFALPGGKIGVHTGILRVATTPDQLAAVLAHEVGHVIARHGAERVSGSLAAQGGLAALDQALGGSSPGRTQLLSGLVSVGFLLPHSRTQESEADMIGLDLMAKAGFDPRQSVDLWINMKAAGGGAPPEWLSTHPSNDTRIENLKANIPGVLPDYEKARASGKAPQCRR